MKAAILMGTEQQGQYLADIGLQVHMYVYVIVQYQIIIATFHFIIVQVSLRGTYTDPNEAVQIIDSISSQDVTNVSMV